MRMALPDLEVIARLYLKYLEEAESGCSVASARYDWMVLELLDQLTRHRSGGEMFKYWQDPSVREKEFILERVGSEAAPYIAPYNPNARTPAQGIDSPTAAAVGAFRCSGEAHLWMYDRHSARKLLAQAGFKNIRVVDAGSSQIPNWKRFNLDTLPDGTVRKPDSFFVEATA